jgi:tetratricopeptide (TPR) repeat protein
MKNRYTVAAVLGITLFLAGTVALAASNEAIRRNNFGAELVKQGRLDEAAKEFQSAILAEPRYAAAHLNLAFTYDRLGRADEAIVAYKKAAELDPSNGTALNNLGVLYMKKELYDEAISALEQGLKADQANPTLQKNLDIAKKGRDNLTEREARIANARKQASSQPKDPRAAYNVARVYAAFDMPDPALEWLGKALQLGFDDLRSAREDPALAGLRTDPRFTRLLESR